MKLIPSFQIDHTRLKPGIYVSRRDEIKDGWITTFDIRLKMPNREPALHPGASHTMEHIVATYLRNSAWKDSVVYFGPMGCLTGFYFITRTEKKIGPRDVEKLIRAAFKFQASFVGAIPGARAAECGNHLLHDLPMAKLEAKTYLAKKLSFVYPKCHLAARFFPPGPFVASVRRRAAIGKSSKHGCNFLV